MKQIPNLFTLTQSCFWLYCYHLYSANGINHCDHAETDGYTYCDLPEKICHGVVFYFCWLPWLIS